MRPAWPARFSRSRVPLWIARTGVALLALLVLYGPTLNLPFSWDDAPHYFIATTVSVDDLWRGTQNYGWYRPAIFTLYKLLFAAPPGLIGLARAGVLLAHAVSCGLLGGIAARYWRTLNPQSPSSQAMIAAWTATGLGVVYPFAVLPLPHLGTAMHVFIGLGLVVCTAALLRALEERDRSALGVACASALLSPYFHESGVMVGAAATLAGVIWL
ncbi:MAG: hypothetical protein JNL73_09700, partial [Anaerolineales bacterium]|nr:hypothetical protein [Anaerolineales bacterium]